MNEIRYDVTLLVASYNPTWGALERTLCSILNQKDVSYQIVVSDDGSKEDFFEECRNLFNEYRFEDFKLLHLDVNKGTCYNIYNGLLESDGIYVKTIGPGDCLFDEFTLLKWFSYAEEKSSDVCFGDAVFFTLDSMGQEQIISKRRYPQNVQLYCKDTYCVKEGIYNYVLLGDVAWGANLITRKNIMIQYMERIIGKIKYAEDMIYRMMVAEGAKITYFPENVVWYEYGSGISTSSESKWNKIISNERTISNNFIANDNIFKGLTKKRFSCAIHCMSDKKKNWIKYLLFPGLIIQKIKKDSICAMTEGNIDIELLYKIAKRKV